MSDADRLYEHLAATAELPVERSASRLLGEAEAVADDLREADPDVQAERAAVVEQLLAKVDTTGHSEADEHVEQARALASALADE
ncbi:hypothetical protein [Natronomonas amylolytica]|uniref:hypothetical protein n=1 Tax=Natronomonas amylolytica TaxID=3108498 RepID=UPI00300AE566